VDMSSFGCVCMGASPVPPHGLCALALPATCLPGSFLYADRRVPGPFQGRAARGRRSCDAFLRPNAAAHLVRAHA